MAYAEINKLAYAEINKLAYAEINKLAYAEINKFVPHQIMCRHFDKLNAPPLAGLSASA